MSAQQEKAAKLRALGKSGIYVLPNAWDAGSAVLTEKAGASVIATSSAGVSWSLGFSDGEHLSREQNIGAITRIVEAVQVPVTADIEGGYGPSPIDVAETIHDVIRAGAVGVNLEDSNSATGALFTIPEHAARLIAARAAAQIAGLPEFVINARTDVFLFEIGKPEGRLDDVLRRAAAYAEAGADFLFVPGLADLDTIARLVAASPLPVNIMVGSGSPTIEELETVGVRRVSLGASVAWAAYSLVIRAAREAFTAGTYDEISNVVPFSEINGAFAN